MSFYRYKGGFLHQKAMLVDDNVSVITTVNMDNRSFRLNFEIGAVLVDEQFAAGVERMFITDFARSDLMTGQEYEESSFPFRLVVRLARLFSPVL